MAPRPPLDVDALRTKLLTEARAVVARDGVTGLTMRALAANAGTSVGLSYRAFSSRGELLRELMLISLAELGHDLDEWIVRPGGALGDRLMEFYDLYVESDAPDLVAHAAAGDDGEDVLQRAADAGLARSWAKTMTEFLRRRQELGEVRAGVDVEAFGFILTAAMHHVFVGNEAFRMPDRETFARYVRAVADAIGPEGRRA